MATTQAWNTSDRLHTPRAVTRRAGVQHGETLAKALGWFSIGLGVAELLAPKAVSRAVGMGRPHAVGTALYGLREIATGVGILTTSKPTGWLLARVAGDVLDLATLGSALPARRASQQRLLVSAAAVLGVSALDLLATQQVSQRRRLTSEPTNRGIRVQRTLTILCEPSEAFAFWRNLENLPRFMYYLESVEPKEDGKSHWVAKGPAGTHVSWDAEIDEERAGELLRWRSLPGSMVQTTGEVRFRPAPGRSGTEVRVLMTYNPPGGQWGDALAHVFGRSAEQEIREDLRRFKRILETGEVPTTAGQSHGSCL